MTEKIFIICITVLIIVATATKNYDETSSLAVGELTNSVSAKSNIKKSNLDWIPYDTTPHDNEFEYYKIEILGNDKNEHYLLKINTDDDTVTASIGLFKNEWSSFEGGRITGRYISEKAITWTNTDKTSGEFIVGTIVFKFQINNNILTVEANGNEYPKLSGTYKQAQAEE